MNIHQTDDEGVTIQAVLGGAHEELAIDLVGFWAIVSSGRYTFQLQGGDLREYIFLYSLSLASRGAVVIDGADDGVHYWAAVDRYGTKPEDVAHNVTAEWIDQGEPDPPAWASLAFALPDYLDSPENRRDWPKPQIELPG